MLRHILLYLLVLSLSVSAEHLCPLGEGEHVRMCPVCSDSQAGVRWTVSTVGTHITELHLFFKCNDSSGSEVALQESYCLNDHQREGDYWKITAAFIALTNFSRINAINAVFSPGVVCAFKGQYRQSFNNINIPEESCTVNETLDCDNNPESCNFPATCNTVNENCECNCNSGYQEDSCAADRWNHGYWNCLPGLTCNDVNECHQPEYNSTCDGNADCVNTVGGYHCDCRHGYTGNGTHCSDIDECEDSNPCDVNADCMNTEGGYHCQCHHGYIGNGTHCSDVDECQDSNPCDANADCMDTEGSYHCQCRHGYFKNGTHCSDVDECDQLEYNTTCDGNADCMNTVGGYHCECHHGYTGNGTHCSDINECSDNSPCDANADCMNTVGGYQCQCHNGYTGNGTLCSAVENSLFLVLGCSFGALFLAVMIGASVVLCCWYHRFYSHGDRDKMEAMFFTSKVDLQVELVDPAAVPPKPKSMESIFEALQPFVTPLAVGDDHSIHYGSTNSGLHNGDRGLASTESIKVAMDEESTSAQSSSQVNTTEQTEPDASISTLDADTSEHQEPTVSVALPESADGSYCTEFMLQNAVPTGEPHSENLATAWTLPADEDDGSEGYVFPVESMEVPQQNRPGYV